MESQTRRTPLCSIHESLGARMVEFGGWWMPVQYQGIIPEHTAVRTRAGLFDISHMGQVFVSGPGASTFLNTLLTNDVNRLQVGQGQYTLMLNREGGVIDDLLCYRIEDSRYLLLVNASMIEEDFAWIQSHSVEGVVIENQSDLWAGLALQGPHSARILSKLLGDSVTLPKRNRIIPVPVSNGPVLLARTGYTGEDGFEWFCSASTAGIWWEHLLQAGQEEGLIPCGLGARDTLRLEMGFALNGSDLSPKRTPLEAGLGTFVKLEKPDFVGKSALVAQQAAGVPALLVGLVMEGKTPPPRSHYPVLHAGAVVGETTSGCPSPTLGVGIAMAYLPPSLAVPGTRVEVDIRGRTFPATVSARPMYQPHQ